MNAKKCSDLERFLSAIGDANSWNTIDELVDACDQADYWTAAFEDHAALNAKKSLVRRLIKQAKGNDGFPVFASVETLNDDGKRIRRYKQETLFDVEDYRQVTSFHVGRAKHHRAMARNYSTRCYVRFDVQLAWDFAESKAKKVRRKQSA